MRKQQRVAPGRLVLFNAEQYAGFCPYQQQGTFFGEVVFTTGMVGYVESLTDPSFKGQILVFTHPLIGNYGAPAQDKWESPAIQASGVVIDQLSLFYSHFEAKCSFLQWVLDQKIPLLWGVDTRTLTRSLRKEGVALGAITTEKNFPTSFPNPNCRNLVAEVSTPTVSEYGQGEKKVIVVDCGMKENILRHLLRFPLKLKRVPYNYDYTQEPFDAVFISNGPGDPSMCQETITILRKALAKNKPIFGICLGSQLLALSAGARTYKLPFGHRGQNQPCQTKNGRCYLTSQNHGYAIDEASLSADWEVTFRHLNDLSVAGIAHKSRPFFAVQFHPEASPGPSDTEFLFDQFYEMIHEKI